MSFARFDPTVKSYFTARSSGPHCSECGEAMRPGDETMCDDCARKDAIIEDAVLQRLADVIERRIGQLFAIKIDAGTPADRREYARGGIDTARAILLDLRQIDKEEA